MRVFKSAWFAKFVRKEQISDLSLCEAVARAERGLIDADLGSGLIKQRVARTGAGRSGGYRTLLFFRNGARAVFAFGFAKSGKANLDVNEELLFRKAARLTLSFSEQEMDREVQAGRLTEVICNG